MKTVYFLILVGVIATLSACNQFKSDHPQAAILDEQATNLTAKSILKYADSVDKNISQTNKQTSLIYMLGDLSFYVEKFNLDNQTVLMVEHAFSGGLNTNLKKYYFRNDSLILELSQNKLTNDDENTLKDSRTYLRNNTVFKLENRTAAAETAINSLPYLNVPLSENKNSDKSHLDNVKTLNDVVDGTDKFDMVFDSITTYPDARYLILRSKIQNSYTASILIKDKDALVDSLLNDPIHFKAQKLNFKWMVKNQEAIYVPVVSNTSANGLNR